VKPRKSSEVSGIRSAPGTPAASAICFGSERAPSNPPPAKPRLIDVSVKSFESRIRFVASSMWPRTSERSRIATSFASSRVSPGSLWNRIASSSTDRFARRSCGRRRAAAPGTEPVEVRQPPGDRHAEPSGRGRVVALEPREQVLELALRVAEPGAVRGDAGG